MLSTGKMDRTEIAAVDCKLGMVLTSIGETCKQRSKKT